MRTGSQVALPQSHFGKEQRRSSDKRTKQGRRIKIVEKRGKTKEKRKRELRKKK
jgi:hypothetical protein